MIDLRTLAVGEWTPERKTAWEQVLARATEVVPLYHPREGHQVLVIFDASDSIWGGCVTQVPIQQFSSGVLVTDVYSILLGFTSGAFKGAQVR